MIAHPRAKNMKRNSPRKDASKSGGSHGPLAGPCLFAAEPFPSCYPADKCCPCSGRQARQGDLPHILRSESTGRIRARRRHAALILVPVRTAHVRERTEERS